MANATTAARTEIQDMFTRRPGETAQQFRERHVRWRADGPDAETFDAYRARIERGVFRSDSGAEEPDGLDANAEQARKDMVKRKTDGWKASKKDREMKGKTSAEPTPRAMSPEEKEKAAAEMAAESELDEPELDAIAERKKMIDRKTGKR